MTRPVLALRAAQAGATAIAAVVAGGGVRTDFKSGGHDLVTTADKAAEAAVIEVIRPPGPMTRSSARRAVRTRDVRFPLAGRPARRDRELRLRPGRSRGLGRRGDRRRHHRRRHHPGVGRSLGGGVCRDCHRRNDCPALGEPAGPRRAGAGLLRPALRPRRPAAGFRHHRGPDPADQRGAHRGFRRVRFPRPRTRRMRRLRRLRDLPHGTPRPGRPSSRQVAASSCGFPARDSTF